MWLLLIVFAVTVNLCIYKTSVSAQSCTPCFGGEALTNTNGRSAVGIPCSFIIAQTNGADSNTTFCQDTQMSAYQGCGCSEYDESTYCSMCNNSFYDIDVRDRPVPLFPGKNCEQLLFPRRDSGICDDVERAAYHCGCPDAPEPVCSFCSDGRPPSRRQALLPPSYQQTCEDLHQLAPFYLSNETCQAFKADSPIQVESYCGCGEDMPSNLSASDVTCRMCENETTVLFSDLTVEVSPSKFITCAEVDRLAQSSLDDDYCVSLQEQFTRTCCLGILPTANPTTTAPSMDDIPTLFPVSPTTSPTESHAFQSTLSVTAAVSALAGSLVISLLV